MRCSTVIHNGRSENVTEEAHNQNLSINYSFTQTHFGGAIIASTTSGLCFLGFMSNEKSGVKELYKRFTNASLTPSTDQHIESVIEYLAQIEAASQPRQNIPLHLIGTPFQLKVWEALLEIPYGEVTSYSDIANNIANPRAVRAAASAIGKNPIAILVPCHRVLRMGGKLGGYHWGLPLKEQLLKSEGKH